LKHFSTSLSDMNFFISCNDFTVTIIYIFIHNSLISNVFNLFSEKISESFWNVFLGTSTSVIVSIFRDLGEVTVFAVLTASQSVLELFWTTLHRIDFLFWYRKNLLTCTSINFISF
jgi:hypothetical protein